MINELIANFLNLNESTSKLAIIVKGNPKYINSPKMQKVAHSFYERIKTILVNKGYRVEFDAGEPLTRPDIKATVWVAHSRGVDRLRFAPDNVKTLEIQTQGEINNKTNDEIGFDLNHYTLSADDIINLNNL